MLSAFRLNFSQILAISFEKANVVSLYELSISFAVSALSKLPTVIIL